MHIFYIIYLVFGLLSMPILHDIHISKCNIHYKSSSTALQISTSIFIDDLELALERHGADKLYIGTEKEDEEADEWIREYLLNYIKIKLNGRELQFHFIGKEMTDDLAAIWCYLEVEDLQNFTGELEIENAVFLELYDDQQNIISIKEDGQRVDFFVQDKDKTTHQINLN